LKEGILFEKGSISADEFVTETWLQLGVPENPDQPYDESYFRHLISWYEHRNDPNVFLLFYEEMVEDIVSVVQALADFLDLKEEKNIRAALQNSSFDVMKSNWQKFSIEKSSTDSESLTGTKPLRLQFSIVGTGKSAIEAQSGLSDEVKATIQEYWNKDILSVSGCITYEELRRKVRRERPLNTASGCL
ncbi:sulfotransferase domain-containing, partial [Paramuricea clavata]